MLRSLGPVRACGPVDVERALEICAEDPVNNVFVAARILESGLVGTRGPLFAYASGEDRALVWCSANVVPVQAGPRALGALAAKVVKRRATASSLFGPADQVLDLWGRLERHWGQAREIRARQLVLTTRTAPSTLGIPVDPAVRLARMDDLDLLVPAAAAMFTEEIGYPPYRGNGMAYRRGVAGLIEQGRSLVRVEDGQVVFKADLGSVALGVAQVQGVWVHPDRRGKGLAAPAMAAVIEHAIAHVAPVVTLYVNDFNERAVATYHRVGMEQTGTFATVLL
ncbi:GNAT family N-acetyltransferase [Ornithinimicrobium pratense]|uniref:GNAT family N-acetyltransferase n=1 Tax=Ornithinimicrobium pratense TaxID=2593973 RepID=A0A5J6V714_9MICO|nr:GNAT family N-acetyltransferase [Ornithinimicrobium pratense]QFG68936.1 GNAT family N-acetyltransferase [Ornithinimicrobium pratense]